VTDSTVLRVANTPSAEFLLQSELKAIQDGLEFTVIYFSDTTYYGYVNKDGEREGVGMRIW
jgi:hypothetical protein